MFINIYEKVGALPLSTPCGCEEDSSPTTTAVGVIEQNELVQCPAIVHETVCIQAEVTIKPSVSVGEISSFCVGAPVIGPCQGEPSPTDSCGFIVSQSICVQVPLTFSAEATATPHGIFCGTPFTGPCPI